MAEGTITRRDIISDDALNWGQDYVKNLEGAIGKNKEFVQSIIALNEANNATRNSKNEKELQENIKRTNEISQKTISIWKEQNDLEKALISTKKKNELATEGTNKALIKERTLLSETNKEIKQQVREQLGLVSSYEKLNRARNQAQKKLADLLSAEKQNTKEVIRAQMEFDKLDARVKAVDASIKNYSKNIGNYSSAFQGLSGTMRELASAFGIVASIALFGTVVKDIFTVVKDFDRQLIAVGKTTNLSGEELKQFGREVVDLGDKLDGVTVDGLIQSAEVAGQLGVTGTSNILKFSEAIEKLKLTSNIISEEQVGQFAKFIEVSSDSFDNADKLASVITQLGNSFATTEAEVLANSTEIQKSVAVYNTSAQGVLALGAATSTLGSEAEVSGSAIQKTFGVINNAVATGKNLSDVLKLTNLTQSELSRQFNKDATGVFLKFVKGLNDAKNSGENLQTVLGDLQLDEVRTFKVIGSLASNYGILESAMAQANEEYKVNAALNKEVAAASESIASIIGDLRDKWEAYVLQTNDASGGTNALTTALKFLRDNFKQIIDFTLKAGSVFLTYVGVVKAYNFVIAASTAFQTAWVAGQIRFAIATGIGTKSILAQAEAAKAATASQTAMNVAVKATPWGLILGFLSAAVAAYIAFNDQLNETDIRLKSVQSATKALQETEAYYNEQSDKYRERRFKEITDEIELRKAKGENSKKLDEEEIQRKKQVIEAELKNYQNLKKVETERTKSQIEESNKRIEQLQKEYDETSSLALRNPFGESVKDKQVKLINAKAENDAMRATLEENNRISIEKQQKLQKILEDLDNQSKLKDATVKAEEDKKAIEARKKRLKAIYDAEKKAADDLFKLQQFRLQVAIDTEQEILDNEKGTFESRLDALLESNQLIQAKITEAAEYELRQLGKYNEEKGVFVRELSDLQIKELIRVGNSTQKLTAEQQLIYEKYQDAITASVKKGEKDREKLIDNQVTVVQKKVDTENQGIDTDLNKEITKQNKLYKAAQEAAAGNFELMEKATKEHEMRLFNITQEFAKKKLAVQIEALENLLKDNELSVEKRAEVENKLSGFKKELSEIDIETNRFTNAEKLAKDKEYADAAVEIQKQAGEKTKALAENLAYSLIDLTNAVFDARISNLDSEIQAVTAFYDEQIEAAGNDVNTRNLLEAEKERKTKAIEKERRKEIVKAAIFNRVVKLAEIGMNLAVTLSEINKAAAAMDFYAAFGFGVAGGSYRAINIPLAIATAAAQAATVLATPLPKYKTGRKDGPEEWAIVGDGGRSEVIERKRGGFEVTPASDTLVKLYQGDKVHKSIPDFEKVKTDLFMEQIREENQKIRQLSEKDNSEETLAVMKETLKAIKAQKHSTTVNVPKIDLNHELWKLKNIRW